MALTEPFTRRLPDYLARLERTLAQWLPPESVPPARLHAAMRYAVLGGGKRLRPTLVYATGEALGIAPTQLDGLAASVEFIHAYSLVHDDLPAMDDDDLRRGRATCHKAFDEATAILVGDALQTLAFDVLARDPALIQDPEQRLHMVAQLSIASGSRGMAGGQAMDLAATGHTLDLAELEDLHIHKTGALIRASVLLACESRPSLDRELRECLDHFAKCIGLAFQIQDDVLDVEGDTATLGKTSGADAAHDKATYPALLGLSESKARAHSLVADALESLTAFGDRAEGLRWVANYIIRRGY